MQNCNLSSLSARRGGVAKVRYDAFSWQTRRADPDSDSDALRVLALIHVASARNHLR